LDVHNTISSGNVTCAEAEPARTLTIITADATTGRQTADRGLPTWISSATAERDTSGVAPGGA
jgi:hypothetical protein